MVTTRSKSGKDNESISGTTTRAKSSGTTKKVDPKTKASKAKRSAKYKYETPKVDPTFYEVDATESDEIDFEACLEFMRKDYLVKHPPPPSAILIPDELNVAGQEEWYNMSYKAKRPWIQLVKKKYAPRSSRQFWLTMKRQEKGLMAPTNNQKRGYVVWNSKMDSLLILTLFDQINQGNKGDGGFKPQAYQAVVDKLRQELGISVTVDHVKNRIKVLKKHYVVITEIRTYTKFKWDEDKKMVVISIDDLKEWKTYCEEVPHASAYQNKSIENWDDICMLFGSDRAMGDGAEQHEESAAAMELENEIGSASEATSGGSNKRMKRDRLADAVCSFAEAFNEYVSKAKGPPRPSCTEIYDVVSNVRDISRHHILKAVKWFMNGTIEEFEMLKNLPENEKLDWVKLCINE